MLSSEIIAVRFESQKKNARILCVRQNVEFSNVKPGGKYSNHYTSKANTFPHHTPAVYCQTIVWRVNKVSVCWLRVTLWTDAQ